MIEISDGVKSKIREILEKNPGKYLRLKVDGDGCAGPYLGLSLDEPDYGEKPVEIDGIEFLISDDVRQIAVWTRIDIFLNQPTDCLFLPA
ncbi:MAG: hypothetical protein JXA46_03775 [Dehalococcoidales bacterium]|nr:hypothetical protein [Dehalococcoidales bacterium]